MTTEDSNVTRLEVHHHYIPIFGWVRNKGNDVMVQFLTNVSEDEIVSAFQSPSAQSTLDMQLVEHFKTMARGKAIKLPKDDTLNERQLKVRVGKAAKAANRKLEWAPTSDGGFIVRVIEILQAPQVTTNGTVASNNDTPAEETPAQETPTRNRR